MTKLEVFSLVVPVLGFFTGSYLIFTKDYPTGDEVYFSILLAIAQGIEIGLVGGYLFF